ncbi:FKBP-type peptidyl-prolyl cis-trans isomerase [Nitrosovibrio sp. Nv17]|uniref:FKBP-type peptidyl-prolyl cis-trans isomerase n=1 Tax=Nitrosovibrio sp. Nv17 TaxID=1855339 RepID=UPI000908531E|nr:FKBP-type peptidyl-prolyl cis-trans isomerase [Nitrosovibrio sp. Nv17]SFW34190.1 FKBP-type peptidyl-prolyl cis-trans isomerase FkpA [Nitrosovibrio sp. Nv17]
MLKISMLSRVSGKIAARMGALMGLGVWLAALSVASVAYAETHQGGVTRGPELIKKDVAMGTGEEAVIGKVAEVHYTGWLYDASAPEHKGKQFDSSRSRGVPFSFLLGAGRVIKGWDRGVTGMKVGGRRILVVPPGMAYGAQGAGKVIPPDATLIFDVELLGLSEGSTH